MARDDYDNEMGKIIDLIKELNLHINNAAEAAETEYQIEKIIVELSKLRNTACDLAEVKKTKIECPDDGDCIYF